MTPRLTVIEIVAADMARSLAFYRLLGIDIPADADAQPHVEVDLGGIKLDWDTVETIRSFDPEFTRTSGNGGISLAFDCGEPAQVDATFRTLVDAGHTAHLHPWDAFWGQRYATVLDPDGNGVDLFATLPAT